MWNNNNFYFHISTWVIYFSFIHNKEVLWQAGWVHHSLTLTILKIVNHPKDLCPLTQRSWFLEQLYDFIPDYFQLVAIRVKVQVL